MRMPRKSARLLYSGYVRWFVLCTLLSACGVESKEHAEEPTPLHKEMLSLLNQQQLVVSPVKLEALIEELNPAVKAILTEIRANARYHQPTPQDTECRGIYPNGGKEWRSEPIYPPFVLGPRRQTDSLVRQLYQLLPKTVRMTTAFVIPDRLVQNPEAYLPYLLSRSFVVVVGNFVGIGAADKDYDWFLERHKQELWMAEVTIRLAKALGAVVTQVRYTMGDSTSDYAPTVRDRLQGQLDDLGQQLKVSWAVLPISWGADEGVPLAFAAQLPPLFVKVHYATETCRHHYDGKKLTREVVESKLKEARLVPVDYYPHFEVFVLTNASDYDGSFPNASAQQKLDEARFAAFRALPPEQRRNLAIIDARMFNGAYNAYSAPDTCDYLAYGSWGTMANKAGTTLATAKLLYFAQKPKVQRQLFLEAVAHDVYANGYVDGRWKFTPLLKDKGITFNHWYGYEQQSEVETVFDVVDDYVNQAMQKHFTDTSCMAGRQIRLTPQLWRTFESEAHLVPWQPGETTAVGIFRTDLPPEHFDPTYQSQGLNMLPLEDITLESPLFGFFFGGK